MRARAGVAAADLRRRAQEYAGVLGVSITFVVTRGDPYTELRRVADEVRADAVVVGASTTAGHRGSGRWRSGWSRPAGGQYRRP